MPPPSSPAIGGLSTALAGNTGALAYTTGHLDLLGVMDGEGVPLDDPWQGIKTLQATQPEHPLCRLAPESIHDAFAEFTSFLCSAGLNYLPPGQRNETVLSPVGTLKKTLCTRRPWLRERPRWPKGTPA